MTEPVEWKNRIVGYEEHPASWFVANPRNWRIHGAAQASGLGGILRSVGIVQNVIVNQRTGNLLDGHLRVTLALRKGDETTLPVTVVDLSEDEEATILATLDPIGAMAGADRDQLAGLFASIQTDDEAVQELLTDIAQKEKLIDNLGVEKDAKPNPRNLPLDIIYTLQGADGTCCLAVRAGWKYGIQSPHARLCPYCTHGDEAHKVAFVDNDYFDYNHAAHIAMVSEHRPKYATVCDVMTPAQCEREKVTYHEFAQILDWAEELREYAENVIVIPKYDCIDQIPDHFMFGYSVPTSHGGTPLPTELFRGRRVHLLGGSWRAQLAHIAALGNAVVSIDNNYIANIASQFGSFEVGDGETRALGTFVDFDLVNPRYVALAISFGTIAAKVNELFGKGETDADGTQL